MTGTEVVNEIVGGIFVSGLMVTAGLGLLTLVVAVSVFILSKKL